MGMTREEFVKKHNIELRFASKEEVNKASFTIETSDEGAWNYVTDSSLNKVRNIDLGNCGIKKWKKITTKDATYILFWKGNRRLLFTSTEDYDALDKVAEEAFK